MKKLQKNELTLAQRRVLNFIIVFISEHGYSPTFVEITDGLGFASANSACDHVNMLKKKGYVTSSKTKNRSLVITQPIGQGGNHGYTLQGAMADLNGLRSEDQALVLQLIRTLKGNTGAAA